MSDIILKAPCGANKNRKKVGRGMGSGLGKTSGKGHKGQNARSAWMQVSPQKAREFLDQLPEN